MANVAWNRTGEHVPLQAKVPEAVEGADAGRDLTVQGVEAQVECAEEREVADGRGDGAGEPLGVEVQSDHPRSVPLAARDALPGAVTDAPVPGGQHP